MRSVLSARPVTFSHAFRKQISLVYAERLTLLPSGRAFSTMSKDEAEEKKRYVKAINEYWLAYTDNKKHQLEFTEEESAADRQIMNTYNSNLFKRQNKFFKDIADKVWCQQRAIEAMPEHLAKLAKTEATTHFPRDRPLPIYLTPPIKDFDFRKYTASSFSNEDNSSSL